MTPSHLQTGVEKTHETSRKSNIPPSDNGRCPVVFQSLPRTLEKFYLVLLGN
jgi:hypothetical protein